MTRSKKGRAPKLAGEIPDKVRDLTKIRTYWDNGNVYVEPDIDGTYMLQLSLVQRKDVAAYIFSKTDGVAVDFNQANATLLHELGDLGVKLLAAQLLSFNDASDAADATDGQLHVAITQDPTNPAQYDIATHHPPWITAASIPADDDTGLVSKSPTSGNPNSVDATGTQVLSGTSNDRAVDVGSTGGFAAFKGSQIGSTTPVEAPIVLVRDPLSSVPFVQIQPSTVSDPGFQFPIDGHGTISARAYAALPTPDASYLSEIIRRTDNPDTFWMCIDTPLGYAWAQFIGPAGAAGANGTNGTNGVTPQLQVSGAYIQVSYDGGTTWSNLLPLSAITGPAGANGTNGTNGSTPLFNSPSVVGLSYGSGPTLVQSGDGSSATPYHQTFGIPAGEPGTFSLPSLPNTGDPPLTFNMMIPADGAMLPWILPLNYTVQITASDGIWEINDTAVPSHIYFCPGTGAPGTAEPNGLESGRILIRIIQVDSNDNQTAITTAADAFVENVMLANSVIKFEANGSNAEDPKYLVGYVIATILITAPPTPTSGIQHLDFTASHAQFTQTSDTGVYDGTLQPEAIWVSGVGWTNLPFSAGHYNSRFKIWGAMALTAHITQIVAHTVSDNNIGVGVQAGHEYGGSEYFTENEYLSGTGANSGQICGDPGVLPAGSVFTISWGAGGVEPSQGQQLVSLDVYYADYPPF